MILYALYSSLAAFLILDITNNVRKGCGLNNDKKKSYVYFYRQML